MRVLVTGGNGFIGKYVCKCLIENKIDVISLDRKQVYDCINEKITMDIANDSFVSDIYNNIKRYYN